MLHDQALESANKIGTSALSLGKSVQIAQDLAYAGAKFLMLNSLTGAPELPATYVSGFGINRVNSTELK